MRVIVFCAAVLAAFISTAEAGLRARHRPVPRTVLSLAPV
jgi:hypothetical protein